MCRTARPATATHNSGQEVRLHDLALQHAQVYAAWTQSVDETSDKESKFYKARPEHPAQLTEQVRDFNGEYSPRFIGREELDRRKDANLAIWDDSKRKSKILKRYQDDIAALEPYEAECEAVSEQIGLADAERRQDDLWNRLEAIRDEAVACRATTFEGIKAKIQASINLDELPYLEQEEKDGHLDPAEEAFLSLWRDVHQVEG